MIYPESSLVDWIKQYGLSVETKTCANCGKELKTIIPVLIKGYAGLETPFHGCERKFNSAIFTPISLDEKYLWSKILPN